MERGKATEKKDKPMTIAECQVETFKHIEMVRKYIHYVTDKLTGRGIKHDYSKLESPEVELFAEHTNKLASLDYDSPEYRESLANLQIALDHHYALHRHHPEHFKNGIEDMNLIDLIEMICDWKAASMRQHNGNLMLSIEKNAQRFHIDTQLRRILDNTAELLDKIDE